MTGWICVWVFLGIVGHVWGSFKFGITWPPVVCMVLGPVFLILTIIAKDS